MNSRIFIGTGMALILGACGGGATDKTGTREFVVDESLPHGVWSLSASESTTLAARAFSPTAHAGAVIITTTEIIEYYDFDAGQDCSVKYTDKYVTPWNSATQTPTDPNLSVSLAVDGDNMTVTFTKNGEVLDPINLSYDNVYSAQSEAALDADTCENGVDPVASPLDGVWLRTSAAGPDGDWSRMQLTMNGNATGTAQGRMYFEYFRGDDGNACSTSRAITYTNGIFTTHSGHPDDPEAGSKPIQFSQTGGNDTLEAVGTNGGDAITFIRLSSLRPAIAWDCSNSDGKPWNPSN